MVRRIKTCTISSCRKRFASASGSSMCRQCRASHGETLLSPGDADSGTAKEKKGENFNDNIINSLTPSLSSSPTTTTKESYPPSALRSALALTTTKEKTNEKKSTLVDMETTAPTTSKKNQMETLRKNNDIVRCSKPNNTTITTKQQNDSSAKYNNNNGKIDNSVDCNNKKRKQNDDSDINTESSSLPSSVLSTAHCESSSSSSSSSLYVGKEMNPNDKSIICKKKKQRKAKNETKEHGYNEVIIIDDDENDDDENDSGNNKNGINNNNRINHDNNDDANSGMDHLVHCNGNDENNNMNDNDSSYSDGPSNATASKKQQQKEKSAAAAALKNRKTNDPNQHDRHQHQQHENINKKINNNGIVETAQIKNPYSTLKPSAAASSSNNTNNNDTIATTAKNNPATICKNVPNTIKQQQPIKRNKNNNPTTCPSSSGTTATTTATTTNKINQQEEQHECMICGSSLKKIKTLKGRINHLKRCSKKYNVELKDVRSGLDDDIEDMEEEVDGADDDDYEMNVATSSSSSSPLVCATAVASKCTYALLQKTPQPQQQQQQQQSTLTTFFTKTPKSLNQVLMAGAKQLAKASQLEQQASSTATSNGGGMRMDGNYRGGSGKQRRGGGRFSRRNYSNSPCPSYKRISGTDFIVDGFLYAKRTLSSQYFLTHFHSDHYGGITNKWNEGIIYCSNPTANLVHQQLGVQRQYLHPLEMNVPTIIEGRNKKPITVTLLDANHCPGAVMFFFEVNKRKILHVGDFRWNHHLMCRKNGPIRSIVSNHYRLDDLYLDTTYCQEKYVLPTQEEAIGATIDVIQNELQQQQRKNGNNQVLLLFGSYSIGKEKIYLSVAKQLQCKVYVDSRRYKMLSALDWSKDQMDLLTTNKAETFIWVVPLGHINFKHMKDYLSQSSNAKKAFARGYCKVIGFRPTGWTYSAKSGVGGSNIRKNLISTRSNGSCTIHGVPYSEHSAFHELVDCVIRLKPKRIIPTVSVSKSEEQVNLLLQAARRREEEEEEEEMYMS